MNSPSMSQEVAVMPVVVRPVAYDLKLVAYKHAMHPLPIATSAMIESARTALTILMVNVSQPNVYKVHLLLSLLARVAVMLPMDV